MRVENKDRGTFVWGLIFVVAIMLLFAGPARAESRFLPDLEETAWGRTVGWQPPNKSEIIVLTAALSVLVIDMGQTMKIETKVGLNETNPILGRKPGNLRTGVYFGAVMLATAGVWYLLPPKWRLVPPLGMMLIEIGPINTNIRNGLGIQIPFA